MSEVSTPQASESTDRSGPRKLAAELLNNGPVQAGGMVASITLVGQAAAQFNQDIALYIALLFSGLLAAYQIKVVEKARMLECCIIIPIAALILFSLSVGANNSIDSSKIEPLQDEIEHLQDKLKLTQDKLVLQTKALDNAKQYIGKLEQILALPSSPTSPREEISFQSNNTQRGVALARTISGLFNFLIQPAQAQPEDNEQPSKLGGERQKLLDALRAYEAKRDELQQEKKKLREKLERLRLHKEQAKDQRSTPLWRKW